MTDWKDLKQTITLKKEEVDPKILENLKAGRPWWEGVGVFRKLLAWLREG